MANTHYSEETGKRFDHLSQRYDADDTDPVTAPAGDLPGAGSTEVAASPGGAAEHSVSVIEVIRETLGNQSLEQSGGHSTTVWTPGAPPACVLAGMDSEQSAEVSAGGSR